ncbi:MAG: hypothetical protein WCJ45_07640 [bacterium]
MMSSRLKKALPITKKNTIKKYTFYSVIENTMRKTLENLTKAFVGESQARNRYTIYAGIARQE